MNRMIGTESWENLAYKSFPRIKGVEVLDF